MSSLYLRVDIEVEVQCSKADIKMYESDGDCPKADTLAAKIDDMLRAAGYEVSNITVEVEDTNED